MSAQTRLCLGLLATLTLTACSSAPTHFYTLMSPADAREGQRPVTPPGFQLDVGVVQRVPFKGFAVLWAGCCGGGIVARTLCLAGMTFRPLRRRMYRFVMPAVVCTS